METFLMPVIDTDVQQTMPQEAEKPVVTSEGLHQLGQGLKVAAAISAATALAACGGGSADDSTPTAPALPPPGTYAYPAPVSDQESARFLLQAQFSASTAQIAQLRSTNYNAWLDEQLAARRGVSGWDWLNSRGYDAIDAENEFYNVSYPADYMIWQQLIESSDGLRKRIALALSEIFVVSLNSLDVEWPSHAIAHYWDQLVNNAFGNYRQLLEDVTLNPAMGYFLNTKGNQKEDLAKGRQPDENYAREVLQLMSIGLVMLNQDGTPQLNAQGQPQDSYSQTDITNLARVFTGYDFDVAGANPITVPGTSRKVANVAYTRRPMALTESKHSTLEASFLGTTIAANTPGAAALQKALDVIFYHPNVGPFIGKQLIQRLVTSNPSPAYVGRVAMAFNNNGAGLRGDMRAVIKAVLLDDEARNPAIVGSNDFGKLREPMLRFVQWARTFGVRSAAGSWKVGSLADPNNRLGQSPLRSPSVFNFFRPGYVPPSTPLASAGAVAPEFQLVNETTVGAYLNYMQNVIRSGIYVNGPDIPGNGKTASAGFDIKTDYTEEMAIVTNVDGLVARINLLMCAGQMSPDVVKTISDALKATTVTATSSENTKLNRIAAAIFLTMACAQYLIQK